MADTDTPALQYGVEFPVKLVIGDGVIVGELGTVTLDPGDTADKVIAEFLMKVAEEVMAQTKMALDLISVGAMARVEVPVGEEPDARYLTPEALALVLGNAQDVNEACVPQPCPPFTEERLTVVPLTDAEKIAADCGGCCGGACQA